MNTSFRNKIKALEVAPVVPIWKKDPFIRIKKKVKVPIVQLEEAQQSKEEAEDEREIPITRSQSGHNQGTSQQLLNRILKAIW